LAIDIYDPWQIKFEAMSGFEREKQVSMDIGLSRPVEDIHGGVAVAQ